MNAQQNAFLKIVIPAAQAAQRKWDVPTSVSVAQAIFESSNQQGWGQSQLAREYNNFFGVKAENLKDPETYIELPTHEFVHGVEVTEEQPFQRYSAVADSFDDHGRLLATAKRYAPAMAVRKDPIAFATQLQHCGYSTAPTYASKLWRAIQDYDLTQYDIQPDGPAAAQEVAA
jgi:flagellum-specific peptidoglycan hydrolase FlgJ